MPCFLLSTSAASPREAGLARVLRACVEQPLFIVADPLVCHCIAGTVVAVKVRHPGVGEAIQRDFALMMRVARLTSVLPVLSHLRLEDTLAQFAAPLREQVRLSPPRHPLVRFLKL